MKALILTVCWCILAVLCWPLALLVIILAPLVWLVSLPFRLFGAVVHATFALIHSLLLLPARILGYRSKT